MEQKDVEMAHEDNKDEIIVEDAGKLLIHPFCAQNNSIFIF
jgi:hypothetical protein